MEIVVYLTFIAVLINIFIQVFDSWKTYKNTVVVDSSSLIDGRIIDVVENGFIRAKFVVPKFVLDELQALADNADTLRRERARFGLDNVKLLQESKYIDVHISSKYHNDPTEVDRKLIMVAKKMNSRLLTQDFNLLKVAEIEGINVLNVNALAQALRPAALPGEEIEVKIVQQGSGRGQGVGYLADGTMIVVSNAGKEKNKTIKVSVTRSLQTEAGRMLFAEKVNKDGPKKTHSKPRAKRTQTRRH